MASVKHNACALLQEQDLSIKKRPVVVLYMGSTSGIKD